MQKENIKLPNSTTFTLRLSSVQLARLKALAEREELNWAGTIRLALKRLEVEGTEAVNGQ